MYSQNVDYSEELKKVTKMIECLHSESLPKKQWACSELIEFFPRLPYYQAERLYETYGVAELKYRCIDQEDIINQAILEIYQAAIKYKINRDGRGWTEEHEVKAFRSYVNISVGGALKHWIESVNGYSHYYCGFLLRFKKLGLDLFKSKDEDLIEAINNYYKDDRRVNAVTLLEKMRNMFSYNLTEQYELSKETEEIINQIVERSKYNYYISELKGKMSDRDFMILMDYFLDSKPLTIKAVADKYKMTIHYTKKVLSHIQTVAADVFGVEWKKTAKKQYTADDLRNMRKSDGAERWVPAEDELFLERAGYTSFKEKEPICLKTYEDDMEGE